MYEKDIFLLIIFSILLESCNNKTQDQIEEFNDKESFFSTISKANEMLIRPKKINQTESARNDSCFDLALYKAEKLKIENFKKIFENSNYTGYCCCPETNLSIDFYKDSEKLSTYFVDTVEFKNKVRVFESQYQYSFIIEKKKWKNFIKTIN